MARKLFLADGTPKYYDKETFPIDIHSASAAIAALSELNEFDARCLPLAEKVARWTIENMRDEKGFLLSKTKEKTCQNIFHSLVKRLDIICFGAIDGG